MYWGGRITAAARHNARAQRSRDAGNGNGGGKEGTTTDNGLRRRHNTEERRNGDAENGRGQERDGDDVTQNALLGRDAESGMQKTAES